MEPVLPARPLSTGMLLISSAFHVWKTIITTTLPETVNAVKKALLLTKFFSNARALLKLHTIQLTQPA